MSSSDADKVIPPENGKRASIDSATGEVHDSDSAAGEGPVPQPGSPRPGST
jgi:hypothetical protein